MLTWANSNSVLDPFAGTGKIFRLNNWWPDLKVSAVELEPEWAAHDPRIVVGNALALPFASQSFDAICTSPTYGNRMADRLIDNYERITYTAKLGRRLHPENSGGMQWGQRYREFHEEAWVETRRVLRPGGAFILNMKNHIRAGKLCDVHGWHIDCLTSLGFVLRQTIEVETPGMRYGQNRDKRVSTEFVSLLLLNKAG